MSNLTDRLRQMSGRIKAEQTEAIPCAWWYEVADQAADELERLRAELRQQRYYYEQMKAAAEQKDNEIDLLRAELEAAEARVADLAEALQTMVDEASHLAGFSPATERKVLDALSRTPAQSRAEIEAGALERFADGEHERGERHELSGDKDEAHICYRVSSRARYIAGRLRSEAKGDCDE